jgi:hypothetical protein
MLRSTQLPRCRSYCENATMSTQFDACDIVSGGRVTERVGSKRTGRYLYIRAPRYRAAYTPFLREPLLRIVSLEVVNAFYSEEMSASGQAATSATYTIMPSCASLSPTRSLSSSPKASHLTSHIAPINRLQDRIYRPLCIDSINMWHLSLQCLRYASQQPRMCGPSRVRSARVTTRGRKL